MQPNRKVQWGAKRQPTPNKRKDVRLPAKKPLKKEQEAEHFTQLIQKLEIEQNLRQLQMMREEEDMERYREKQLNGLDNPLERKRLRNIHAVERARFQQRLSQTMKVHAAELEKARRGFA